MKRKLTLSVLSSILFTIPAAATTVGYVTNYSQPIFQTLQNPSVNCELLTGNNREGLIVAGGEENRTIKYLNSYASGVWAPIQDPGIPVSHIAGDNKYGPIVSGGYDNLTVKYLNSYSNAEWITLPPAPFEVEGLAGNNYSGPVIFNGKNIAYIDDYGSKNWKILARTPFPNGNIAGISGNVGNGVIAFSDEKISKLAYLNYLGSSNWTTLLTPIQGRIVEISGDNYYGPIIKYEDGSIWYMSSYSSKIWSQIENYEAIQLRNISGDNRNGIAFCL